MGNLSAEQEAALMAEVADKAAMATATPSSPNSRMREESMLAGLGVIAPEEIGLKRIQCGPAAHQCERVYHIGECMPSLTLTCLAGRSAPPRDAGLLAQLKSRTESERLVRETPSPSSEGNLFLAKLRSMSSSDDARNGSAALSNGSLHRLLSHRWTPCQCCRLEHSSPFPRPQSVAVALQGRVPAEPVAASSGLGSGNERAGWKARTCRGESRQQAQLW